MCETTSNGMVNDYSIKSCTTTSMQCSFSYIIVLDKYAFRTINCTTSSLILLNLYKNNITEVLNVHFSSLINLNRIFLNSNTIITVNRLLFVNNQKLEYINLAHNRIVSNFFLNIDALSSLTYLDVSYNSLYLLNQSVFENFIKKANNYDKRLVVSGNTFRCGSEMKWISDLEHIDFITIIYLATDVCMPCVLFNENCLENNYLMSDKGWII